MKKKKLEIVGLILLMISVATGIISCNRTKTNQTACFFTGIEVQYETAEEEEVIIKALEDMLNLPEDKLKDTKYPDYLGKSGTIGINQVINSYFVPDSQKKVLGDNFYKELRNKKVKKLLKDLLKRLRESKKSIAGGEK